MKHRTIENDWWKFLGLIEQLRDFVIIVEGKKDREALKTLGLYNVIAINGRPLLNVVNELKLIGGRPVILTDFDRAGREIARRLQILFQAYKIHPDSTLRLRVMDFGKNKIQDFRKTGLEKDIYIGKRKVGSEKFVKKESDTHGEIGAYFNKIHNKSTHKDKGSSGKTRRNRGYFWSD